MNNLKEKVMEYVFLAAACMSIFAVVLICLFLFANGIPAMGKIGLFDFLLGTKWKPNNNVFGIMPMILGSIYITAGAIIVGVPAGVLTAVYLAKFCPPKIYKVLKPAIELMAGIPSIVYGLFGALFFVKFLHWNLSLMSGAFTLAIMVLPLIMRTTEEALMSVDDSYREGSFGLGAGKLRTVFVIILPAAAPGILSGVILAIGRIVGETAALIFTAGTVAKIPTSAFDSARTLAVHMYALYSEGLYMNQAYATAVILLVTVIIINALSVAVVKKFAKGK